MNQDNSLNTLGLRQALLAIDQGRCTAEDIINACFDRIEAREDAVGAWAFRLTREEYLQHYRENREFYAASVLKGLPVGVKDIIDTADMPTEMGSAIHQGRQPVDDASCVALIRQAGGMVLGKTVTTEFAYFKPGKTANPRDLERTPGGSSSGSAAAVADWMLPLALGSQTAASVVRPAAYCGVLGYVGSRGEFSLRGAQPLAQSLDSLGLLARTSEDIALMRSILLRQENPLDVSGPIRPKRVMFCSGHQIGDCDPAMERAVAQVAEMMQTQGVEVLPFPDDKVLPSLVECHGRIMAYEVARNLALESARPELLSPPLQALIESGLAMPRQGYLDALQQVERIHDWMRNELAEVDAILAPAAPGVAPLGHEKTGAPHMSRPWQVLGLPVVTLPGMEDEAGLPLGVQLVMRNHEDQTLLQLASWLEGVIRGAQG